MIKREKGVVPLNDIASFVTMYGNVYEVMVEEPNYKKKKWFMLASI